MKKFLMAAAASLLIFGGQVGVEAAPVDLNVAGVETQDASSWTRFRDKVLGRDDRRHHKDWNRHHDYRNDYRDDRRRNYPPPPPPPPPPHRR